MVVLKANAWRLPHFAAELLELLVAGVGVVEPQPSGVRQRHLRGYYHPYSPPFQS